MLLAIRGVTNACLHEVHEECIELLQFPPNGVQKQKSRLGMISPLSDGHVHNIDRLAFCKLNSPGIYICLEGTAHFILGCIFSNCQTSQTLRLSAIVCEAREGKDRARP